MTLREKAQKRKDQKTPAEIEAKSILSISGSAEQSDRTLTSNVTSDALLDSLKTPTLHSLPCHKLHSPVRPRDGKQRVKSCLDVEMIYPATSFCITLHLPALISPGIHQA